MQKFTSIFTEVEDNPSATKVASDRGTSIKAEADVIFKTAKAYVGTENLPTPFVVPVSALNNVDQVIIYSVLASNGDYMDKSIIKESMTEVYPQDGHVILHMQTTGTLPAGATVKLNVKGSN